MITAFAGRWCAPPVVSPGNVYQTSFPGTENPVSQGGMFVNGAAVGEDWQNVQTTPGLAFGSTISLQYDDNIACLTTTFGANQYAQGVVFKQNGYTPPNSHEIELLLMFEITPGNARGYEVLWAFDGHMAIVRWNGALGNFTALLDNVDIGVSVTGDVLRAERSGNTITVYKNGVSVGTIDDATFTDGQPGLGFWPTSGATLNALGWSSYEAGEL